ncbi:hypothetical protein HID58_096232, partial [Brassica napus]
RNPQKPKNQIKRTSNRETKKDRGFVEKMKAETVTLILVNLAGIMERADESLLPGVYKEVGAALHTDPTGLGSLTLLRSMVQAVCYPLAAYMSMRHNRAHVIALGAFLWSAATFLVAFSSTFFQVAVSRALNGIGLALVAPAIQSLVADSTDDANRGTAFGWLQLTANLGSIIGGLCSVLIAPLTFMGVPGWRVAFHIVGVISVIVGVLVRLFANDPHFVKDGVNVQRVSRKPFCSRLRIWSGKVLIGFSHGETAVLMGLFVAASSLGGLFGGKMGDYLSTRLPNSGRIILAQISSASAIPLAAILLLFLPDLTICWCDPCPIFAEIVPEKSRTSVYALDKSFESILSSFAPPVVGILAQHVYGYKPIPQGSSRSAEIATDRENAASLAKALYTSMASQWRLAASSTPSIPYLSSRQRTCSDGGFYRF